jgi:hypothetical protein
MAGSPLKRARRQAAASSLAAADVEKPASKPAAKPSAKPKRGKAKNAGKPPPSAPSPHTAKTENREHKADAAPKIGRPTTFTREIGQTICDHVVTGGTVGELCAQPDMPHERQVYRWLAMHAEFRQAYTRAREIRAFARIDQMDTLVKKVVAGTLDPNAARVAIDALKWQASKENVMLFGDFQRSQVQVNASVEIENKPRKTTLELARHIVLKLQQAQDELGGGPALLIEGSAIKEKEPADG